VYCRLCRQPTSIIFGLDKELSGIFWIYSLAKTNRTSHYLLYCTTIFVLHEAPHEINYVFELFPYEWNKTSAFVHKPNPETSESKKKSFQENQ